MSENPASPWLSNWTVVSTLGSGGQGTTSIVKGSSCEKAVLKVLRKQADPESRRRMFQEVSNLRILKDAGCPVPSVIDSNIDLFDKNEISLYFVMDFIEGERLSEYVDRAHGLPIDKSLEVVFDLLNTMKMAHRVNVLHRDIKPDNIIISGENGKLRAFVVDYGLSFNSKLNMQLTRDSETIDNSFLGLPERRVLGGDRRDARSDITGLCGILYYCITGAAPVDLTGPDGKPPHRRADHSVRSRLGDSLLTAHLEAFLDKGFSHKIDERFQSLDEFESRLRCVIDPTRSSERKDPVDFAISASQAISRGNRKAQLANFKAKSINTIHMALHSVLRPLSDKAPDLEIIWSGGVAAINGVDYDYKEGEAVDLNYYISVKHVHNLPRRIVCYQVRAIKQECFMLRAIGKMGERDEMVSGALWTPVLWFNGNDGPTREILVREFENAIIEAIADLRDILTSESTDFS